MTEHDDQTGTAVSVAEREFSIWVDPDSLPGEGRHVRLAPTEDERGAIAKRLGLLGLPAFTAKVHLRPAKGGGRGVKVTGMLEARVVQACVVSLDPVEEEVNEEFDAEFGPVEEAVNLELTLEDEDPVEPFEPQGIDIGELVVQHLSLSLNPYPRAEGVAVEDLLKDDGGKQKAEVITLNAPSGPFAELAKLKRKD
ncbi:YceD family protein [Hwanghaeella sp.]|uniref:YceD family protein n=1 Tax=Hwanghaeella sp. TaxID=2605943 RepID=UPI003CCC209F